MPWPSLKSDWRLHLALLGVAAAACAAWVRPLGTGSLEVETPNVAAGQGRDVSQEEFSRSVQSTRSTPTPILCPAAGELETVLTRLLPRRSDNLSGLVHSLHLYGPATRVESAGGGAVRVLDLVMDGRLAASHFGGIKSVYATPHGARFWTHEPFFLGTNQAGAEAHPGQLLAALAEQGISLDQVVVLPDGRQVRVRQVFDDLLANLQLRDEIYWDGAALALYLPPAREWRDKFGQSHSLDDLAAALMSKRLANSPCAGTHAVITLALLRRADSVTPVLSEFVRSRVDGYLDTAVEVLLSTQSAAGYWDANWMERMPGQKGQRPLAVSEGDETRLLVTGHHLEWLLLLPADRVPAGVLARAGQWLLKALDTQTRDPEWVREWYCPLSHAARTVCVLAEFDAARFERGYATSRPSKAGEGPAVPVSRQEKVP